MDEQTTEENAPSHLESKSVEIMGGNRFSRMSKVVCLGMEKAVADFDG